MFVGKGLGVGGRGEGREGKMHVQTCMQACRCSWDNKEGEGKVKGEGGLNVWGKGAKGRRKAKRKKWGGRQRQNTMLDKMEGIRGKNKQGQSDPVPLSHHHPEQNK